MGETIYQLVYCSRNTISGCQVADVDSEILRIVDASRRNNVSSKVTGALLFSAGSFAQVLEGPLAGVEKVFERIQRDPRHADVVVLHVLRSQRRDFAEWSMAYAGKLAASSKDARALDYALEQPGEAGATAVLATMHGLVRREKEWAVAAR